MDIERLHLKVLDKKEGWYLAKVSLWEYLSHIDYAFFEYDIQRGIVQNHFLDSILTSIANEMILPPFTLVSSKNTVEVTKDGDLTIKKFDILDGLQRTYRLWMYKHIAEVANKDNAPDFLKVIRQVENKISANPNIISLSQVKVLFDRRSKLNVYNLRAKFETYDVYIYLWEGLSDIEIVKRMLILNAGQKKVSNAHQYELMYMKYIDGIRNKVESGIKLVRYKDRIANKVAKGNREIGTYLVTTVIIGLQSFISGKPIRLSASKIKVEDFDDDGFIRNDNVELFFKSTFILGFINSMHHLETAISDNNNEYLAWFVKDTTLSGIYGAIGAYLRARLQSDEEIAMKGIGVIEEEIIGKLSAGKKYDLKGFYEMYSSLASTRINIGDVIRKIIADYTYNLLVSESASWINSSNKVLK